MDNQAKKDVRFNEFNYSEDAQMALKDALYSNDFSMESVREIAIDASVKVLLIPLLFAGSPQNEAYAESSVSRIEQVESLEETFDRSLVHDPIIQESASISEESPYQRMSRFVKNLSTLPEKMVGLDFVVPSENIVDNAVLFLSAMERAGLNCPEMGSVLPSVFGTIIIDYQVERGLVSLEIGNTKIGFFTYYEDGINEESDGILTDFSSIPSPLLKHLSA